MTTLLAKALQQNGSGKLLSIDASERWIAAARDNLPSDLRSFAELSHSALRRTELDGKPCHRYELLPDVTPDLLYLDGPDPADVPGWPEGEPVRACDPLLLEDRFPAGFRMIVDGRDSNSRFLQQNFKRRYRVVHNWPHKLWTFDLLG